MSQTEENIIDTAVSAASQTGRTCDASTEGGQASEQCGGDDGWFRNQHSGKYYEEREVQNSAGYATL